MTISLGIETSCDETSAAIVVDGRLVRSNVVSSQIDRHAPFGGVVPEIASREHIRAILPVVEAALREADVRRGEIETVAVTHGPGLAGALLVGLTFARGLALSLGVPCIPVNHIEGHLYSVWLGEKESLRSPPKLPMLALVVSGGHTELVLVVEHGTYRRVGATRDDAAGEAFDKVARLLGLGYPGGPAIQAAASSATEPVTLPRAWLHGTNDFSFSGLKTAVLHLVQERATGRSANSARGVRAPHLDATATLATEVVANIAAGFQESVVDVLSTKTARAARELGVASVALVGGVAANRALRDRMRQVVDADVHIAEPRFCTDNAAMIAAAAYFASGSVEEPDVQPGLTLVTTV